MTSKRIRSSSKTGIIPLDISKKIIEDFVIDKKYETCGLFDYNIMLNGEIIINNFLPEKKNSLRLPGERLYCIYKKYDKIIWHTHPDKIYPSLEDILKILKNEIINFSIIFCKFGYFQLYFYDKIDNITDELQKHIQDILNEYYFSNTRNGRDYDEKSIKKLCHKLNYIINKNSVNMFKIKFYFIS